MILKVAGSHICAGSVPGANISGAKGGRSVRHRGAHLHEWAAAAAGGRAPDPVEPRQRSLGARPEHLRVLALPAGCPPRCAPTVPLSRSVSSMHLFLS